MFLRMAESQDYNYVVDWLKIAGLKINEKKSGIYSAIDRRLLGYEFYKTKTGIDVRKVRYENTIRYHNWHPSVLRIISQEYHIIQDGILNKKDYALLFENEQEKHHIPIEVVNQLNIYGNVMVAPGALKTLCERNIQLSVFDKYGNLMGNFIPAGHEKTSKSAYW